jgi:dienelactone hydrolase
MPGAVLTILLFLSWLLFAGVARADGSYDASGPADAAVAIMVIHGGGWGNGAAYMRATEPTAARYAAEYRTFNIGYGDGAQSVSDVLDAHDRVRAAVGPDVPICVMGQSAGGHLALLLAEARDVACTISQGGPTDLTIPSTPVLQALEMQAFGYHAEKLAAASPRRHAHRLAAPVLLVHEANDPVVPLEQAQLMAQAAADARLVVLPDGPATFVHRQVDPGALQEYYAVERGFIAAAAAAWRAAREPVAPAPEPEIRLGPREPAGDPPSRRRARAPRPRHRHRGARRGRDGAHHRSGRDRQDGAPARGARHGRRRRAEGARRGRV